MRARRAREVDGWQDGDEVIVPAVSFVASDRFLLASGLIPRFVDVNPRTYGLDPALLAAAIGPRTRAIMPVHLFGLPCDMEPILAIAGRHGLRVVEDSCETMFVGYRGRPVGSFGDLACFSTRVSHLVSTGIGGFACTSDPVLATIVRSLVNDGRAERSPERPGKSDTGHFVFERSASAIARASSRPRSGSRSSRSATSCSRRGAAMPHASTRLAPLAAAVQLPWCPADREHAFAMYPLVLAATAPAKDVVVTALAERGIESRAFLPLVSQPVVRRRFGDLLAALPVAHRLEADGSTSAATTGSTRTTWYTSRRCSPTRRRRGRDVGAPAGSGDDGVAFVAVRARRRLSAPCGRCVSCRRARRSSAPTWSSRRSLPRRSSLR